METKKSKVTQAKFDHQWDGKAGPMYDYVITLENGDEGQYSSKSEHQTKFVVGQEAEYTIDTKNGRSKISPVYAPGAGGGGRGGWRPMTPEESIALERCKYPSFAVSYWKDILVALINQGDELPDAIKKADKVAEAFMKKMISLGDQAVKA